MALFIMCKPETSKQTLEISWNAIQISADHTTSSAEICIDGILIRSDSKNIPTQLRLYEGGLFLDGELLTNHPIPLETDYIPVHFQDFTVLLDSEVTFMLLKQSHSTIIAPASNIEDAITILERIIEKTEHSDELYDLLISLKTATSSTFDELISFENG